MYFFSTFIFLFLLFSSCDASSVVTLEDAVASALKSNNKLKSAEFSFKASKMLGYTVYSEFLPNVSLGFAFDPQNNFSQSNALLNFNQPIFNGGSSYYALKKVRNEEVRDLSSLNIAKQDLVNSAVGVYMKLLKAKEVTKLCSNTVDVMKKHLQVAEKKLSLGEITKSDFAQVQSKLSSSIAEFVKASGNEAELAAAYTHVVGFRAPSELVYPNTLPEMPTSLTVALEEANKNNNYIRYAEHNREVIDYMKKQAYARVLPSVGLSLSWNLNNSKKPTDPSFFSGINIAIPIFQGGAEYAGIASMKYRFFQAVQDYHEALHSVNDNVIAAWLACESYKSVIKASTDTVAAYELVVESTKKEVELNTKSMIDLLDAENALLSARISLVDSKSFYVIAIYNLFLNVSDINTLFKQAV